MKVLGIIPARYGATRFPGKPLALIQGKPMIQWVYESTFKTNLLNELIVATDDERIATCVQAFGGKVMMTKTSHVSGTDRCAEVLKEFSRTKQFDCVINIQGDEPLIDEEHIKKLINLFNEKEVEIGSLVYPSNDKSAINNPNKVKALINARSYAFRFGRILENVHLKFPFFLHIGLYGFRVETLLKIVQLPPSTNELNEKLEQLRWIDNGYNIKVAKVKNAGIGVDVPEDINKIESILKKRSI